MSNTRTIPIVGAHFRPPAKALLAGLPAGQELWLRPEPSNAYDPNAVAVYLRTPSIPEQCWEELDVHLAGQGFDRESVSAEPEWHIGYMPRAAKGDPEQEAENIKQQLAVIEAFENTGKDLPVSLTFDGNGKPAFILALEDEEETCEECGFPMDECECEDEDC